MPVRLFVTKAKESSDPDVYTFDQDTIIIGRDRAVDLTLHDPDQVISGRHVEITRAETEYRIIDHSKNGTRLNDVKMDPGQPYPLHDDDQIGIIRYRLRVEMFTPEPTAEPEREPVLAEDSLKESAGQLAEALARFCSAFDEAPGPEEAWQNALTQTLAGVKDHEAVLLMAQVLHTATGTPALPVSSQTRLDRVVDAMLQRIPDLAAIPDKFQLEFLEWTRPQHTEFKEAQALKEHLFDPAISEEEADRRTQKLEAELYKLQAHFFGMLNGYRDCVRKGTEHLLKTVNPETLERTLARGSRLYRLLPVLRRLRMVKELKKKYRKLAAGNWAVAEKELFRPAFCEGYKDVLDEARERDRP